MMSDDQLLRYSRQIMLPQIDIEGQNKLLNAHVLIIGLGGLGCPAAMYLAGAGVGRLTLVDPDEIDLSNLQRQVLFTRNDMGREKVTVAAEKLKDLNADVQIDTLVAKLDSDQLHALIDTVDVVLDATDNFESRFAINQACVDTATPLISGAAIQMSGQLAVYDPRQENSPCYRCLYPEGVSGELGCTESGILGPVVGTIGTMQALEAIKLISDTGKTLQGCLMIFDAATMEWQKLFLKADPDCPVCSKERH